MKILEAKGLTKNFGGLMAVSDVSFAVEKEQIKGIIGPNGAGKTTIFDLISGFYPYTFGEIWFKSVKLNGLQSYKIASLGISRTFQNIQIFDNMTVVENVMMGSHHRTESGIFSALMRLPRSRREDRSVREQSLEKLTIVNLESKAYESAENLSYGERKRLEMARALASDPELILLDEPVSGLNIEEIDELAGLINNIQQQGVTILLVEHNMRFIMNVCNDIVVLNQGRVIAEGSPNDIQTNPEVINAYLGDGVDLADRE